MFLKYTCICLYLYIHHNILVHIHILCTQKLILDAINHLTELAKITMKI